MTDKEKAAMMLRYIAAMAHKGIGKTEIEYIATEYADRLDPPKPKQGWYAVKISQGMWNVGYWTGFELCRSNTDLTPIEHRQIQEFRPLLGSRQVAVDIPLVSNWPDKAERLEITMEYWPYNTDVQPWTETEITRKEAKRMENENE